MLAYTFDILRLVFTTLRVPVIFSPVRLIASLEGWIRLGKSHISMEDFAIAMVDEVEQHAHSRQRFTVGY